MAKVKDVVLKFDGGTALVWQHPIKRIDGHTIIQCPHTHEVVYIKEGAMLDSLNPGTHRLIEEPKKSLFKKEPDPVDCILFYVNTQSTLKVLWGTPSKMDVFDAKINVPVSVGLHGSIVISINQARKFISKLGGIDAKYTTDDLQEFFRDMLLMYIKDELAQAMVIEKISFYEIWTNMRRLSHLIQTSLKEKFNQYGVHLDEFLIENIMIPDEIKKVVEMAYLEKFVVETKGLSEKEIYHDVKEEFQRDREVIKEVAKSVAQASKKEPTSRSYCPDCGTEVKASHKFCPDCGNPVKS